MTTMRDAINKMVADYYSGNYTILETHWRLLTTLVEEPEHVDALLADLPPDMAKDRLEWAEPYRAPLPSRSERFKVGAVLMRTRSAIPDFSFTEKENRAVEALHRWLNRNPSPG